MNSEPKIIKTLPPLPSQITSLVFREETIYTSHHDGSLNITNTSKKLPKPKRIVLHKSPITSLTISSNNHFISTTSNDSSFRIFNIQEPMKPKQYAFKTYNGSMRYSDFSNDSKMLISAGDDKSVKIFQVYNFKFLGSLKKHTSGVTTCEFQKFSAEKAISGGFDKTVVLWDLEKKQEISCYKNNGIVKVSKFFSEDNYFLVGDNSGDISIFDKRTNEKMQRYIAHDNGVEHVEIYRDHFFTSVGKDKKIKFWDIRNGINVGILDSSQFGFENLKFFDNYKYLATVNNSFNVNIWNNPFLLDEGIINKDVNQNPKYFSAHSNKILNKYFQSSSCKQIPIFSEEVRHREKNEYQKDIGKDGKTSNNNFIDLDENFIKERSDCFIEETKNFEKENHFNKIDEGDVEIDNDLDVLNNPVINSAFDKIIDQLEKLNKTSELMGSRIDKNYQKILEISNLINKKI